MGGVARLWRAAAKSTPAAASAPWGRPPAIEAASAVAPGAQLTMSWQPGIPHASHESGASTAACPGTGATCSQTGASCATGSHLEGAANPASSAAMSRIVMALSIDTETNREGTSVPRAHRTVRGGRACPEAPGTCTGAFFAWTPGTSAAAVGLFGQAEPVELFPGLETAQQESAATSLSNATAASRIPSPIVR